MLPPRPAEALPDSASSQGLGWNGVTIEASTGNRQPATVVVTTADANGQLHVDPSWAKAVGADTQ